MQFVMPKTAGIKVEHNITCFVCGFTGARSGPCTQCHITYMHVWRQLNREYRNTYLRLLRAHKKKEAKAKEDLIAAQVEALKAQVKVIDKQSTVMKLASRPAVNTSRIKVKRYGERRAR